MLNKPGVLHHILAGSYTGCLSFKGSQHNTALPHLYKKHLVPGWEEQVYGFGRTDYTFRAWLQDQGGEVKKYTRTSEEGGFLKVHSRGL